MMADCYSGYQGITLRSDARIGVRACNAHARRKIFEARAQRSACWPAASWRSIRQLYDIEDRGKTLSCADREALRAARRGRCGSGMRELLDGEAAARVLPKDKFAEALGYLRNHWDALQVYLGDGRLPIDNNETEQLMKQVAIGRKNWLFVGSVAAGERAADFLTIVSSAVRNDLDVWAYVKDVLDRLLAGDRDYAALRPDRWAAAHPEHIRDYRAEERRDRADARRTRRADRRCAATPRDSRREASWHSCAHTDVLQPRIAGDGLQLVAQFGDDFLEEFGLEDIGGFAQRTQRCALAAEFALHLPQFAGLLDGPQGTDHGIEQEQQA